MAVTPEESARRRASKLGDKNPNWKGDNAPRDAGHARARYLYPDRPCEKCAAEKAERHHKDDNTLNNAPDNVQFLCRRCHMLEDGRLAELAARGAAGPSRGYRHTPESLLAMSAASKGRIQTPEARAKVSAANLGKPAWNKGVPRTAETRAKISAARVGLPAPNKGVPHSEETRIKMREAWQRRRERLALKP